MSKIEEIKKKRKWAHDKMLKMKSDVYKAFLQMEKATYQDGEISRKNKELIAIGISVVINCESCMQWHVEQAILCGATEREVIESIEVGIEMGGGPATVHARFALEVLDRIVSLKGRRQKKTL
jgi:AhpD family alkylhydroperoxidase